MKIRVRGPNGVSTIELDDSSSTILDLRSQITKATGLDAFDVKYGYPPKPLELDQFAADAKLADTGLKLNGEQLITSPRDPPPAAPAPAKPASVPSSSKAAPVPSRTIYKPPKPSADDPPEIPIPDRSATLVLRVMPDDNSCLFRAVSSALLPDLDSMTELRSIVASTIQSQPDVYTAAILERAPDAYCAWIQREDSWGGAIELGILSQHFDVEIASVNVQDLRVDRFNEGENNRIILVYSGIHYDVIALNVRSFNGEVDDQKVFGSGDEVVLNAAVELCGELQRKHYFTDTARFLVKCNKCGWTGNGQVAATEHAKETGHYDFGEA